MEVARTKSCRNIARVTVHHKPPIRRHFILGIFVLFYALVLPWVWNTMGAPLQRAKEEVRQMDQQKSLEELDGLDEVEIEIGSSLNQVHNYQMSRKS